MNHLIIYKTSLNYLGKGARCIYIFFGGGGCTVAYGSSLGIEFELQLCPMSQVQQCWILNPLCQARDGTHAAAETMPDP